MKTHFHMKKYLLITVLLSAISTASFAQDNLSWGPMAGVSISNFRGDVSNTAWKTGFTGGLFINYSIVDRFGIGGQLLYTQLGAKVKNSDAETRLNYVQVPILATFYLNGRGHAIRPKLFVGPHVGFLVAARDQNGNNLNADSNNKQFTGMDAGLTLGGGLNYRLNNRMWLNADVRYGLGLVDVVKNTNVAVYNKNWGVNLGLSFPLGKYTPSSGKFTPSRR